MATDKGPKYLPGDPRPDERVERMLRVDHAGEFGAVRIYTGQKSVLGKDKKTGPLLKHMLEQEEVHLKTFETLMSERGTRPTALMPVWKVASWALGAGTALMGEKAAMACTVAVEEVIDGHYAEQVEALGNDEPVLSETFEKFRQEELEHRDIGLEHGAEETVGYGPLTGFIKRGSRLAIWLSERI